MATLWSVFTCCSFDFVFTVLWDELVLLMCFTLQPHYWTFLCFRVKNGVWGTMVGLTWSVWQFSLFILVSCISFFWSFDLINCSHVVSEKGKQSLALQNSLSGIQLAVLYPQPYLPGDNNAILYPTPFPALKRMKIWGDQILPKYLAKLGSQEFVLH